MGVEPSCTGVESNPCRSLALSTTADQERKGQRRASCYWCRSRSAMVNAVRVVPSKMDTPSCENPCYWLGKSCNGQKKRKSITKDRRDRMRARWTRQRKNDEVKGKPARPCRRQRQDETRRKADGDRETNVYRVTCNFCQGDPRAVPWKERVRCRSTSINREARRFTESGFVIAGFLMLCCLAGHACAFGSA